MKKVLRIKNRFTKEKHLVDVPLLADWLFVGIPAMFFYFFFRNRLMGIMSTVQKRASFAIDVLSGEVKLSEEGAPEG